MPWTSPKTNWQTDDIVTANDMNAIGENLTLLESAATGTFTALALDDAAGSTRALVMQTGGVDRWQIAANDTAEGGSSIGSDLDIRPYADDGSAQSVALRIHRSSGHVTVYNDLEIDGTLNHDGTLIGFFGVAPVTRRLVTGSRSSGDALASLLAGLTQLGLIVNGTTS